jgi:hypothetical protein
MSKMSVRSTGCRTKRRGADELQGEVGNGVANLPFSEAQRRLF